MLIRADSFPRSVSRRVSTPRKEGMWVKAEMGAEWGLEGQGAGRKDQANRSWKFLPDLIILGIISNQSKTSGHMFCVDSRPLIKTALVKNSLIKGKVVLKDQFDCRLTWVGRGRWGGLVGGSPSGRQSSKGTRNCLPSPRTRQRPGPFHSPCLPDSSKSISFPFQRFEN